LSEGRAAREQEHSRRQNESLHVLFSFAHRALIPQ